MTNERKRKRPTEGGDGVGLDRDIQGKIGDGLRAMYDDVVKQGVPDRFVELLAKLDQRGTEKSENGDNGKQRK
jgi:hypothetical protein